MAHVDTITEHGEGELLRGRAAGQSLRDLDLAVDPGRDLYVVPADLDAGVRAGNDGVGVAGDGVGCCGLTGMHDLGETVEVEVSFELGGVHGLGVVRAGQRREKNSGEDILRRRSAGRRAAQFRMRRTAR